MYDNYDTNTRVYLIYCDIGNYRHWVKECTSASVFFENYDKLCAALRELTTLNYGFQEPLPSDELKELQTNEQEYIRRFLSRSWLKTVSEAAKLKTDKGRANRISSFFNDLEQYTERFSEETLKMLSDAKKEQPDYSLKKSTKSERDKLFLLETERILDEQKSTIDSIFSSPDDNAWFCCHNDLLSVIMQEEIDSDIIYDITRLMKAGYQYKKASRYLRIKYKTDTDFAVNLYITATGIVSSYKEILHYHNMDLKKYVILTHSNPCPICQEMKGRVFNLSDASIGKTFPPFCRYNCSTTGVYNNVVKKIIKSV